MTDLKTLLAQRGPLDPGFAVRVVRQIADAIDQAHAQQTMHREVSTHTILLAGDGTAYLADGHRDAGGQQPSADRTRSIVTNTAATYHSDISALAAILSECLTGRPPEPGAPQPNRLRVGIPPGLDQVVAKGLAADPDDRYGSAAELAAAAQQALDPTVRTGPSAAATRAIQLPPPPVAANPPPHQPFPAQGRSPTVSYPHSRPVPLPLPPPVRRRLLAPVVAAIVIVGAVVAGAIAIPKLTQHSASTATTRPTAGGLPPRHNYTALPEALPFPGLYMPKNVAVDGTGNVYALASTIGAPDAGMFENNPDKIWKLARGATETTTLQFPVVDVRSATDLAVDRAGNIFFSDSRSVWEVASGKPDPIRLPFRGFSSIQAVTVDQAGNVYALGALMGDVSPVKYGAKKLTPGENRPTDLPSLDLYVPRGIEVDKAGNVYICSSVKGAGHGQVLKISAGTNTTTVLPIPGLLEPRHVAFNSAGDMFVADGFVGAFFELPAAGGDAKKILLPAFSNGITVDSEDNLYVATAASTDRAGKLKAPGQVLKIKPAP